MEKTIVKDLSAFFNLRESDIIGRSKKCQFVKARHIGMWFLRKNTELSLNKIGDVFYRDHAVVITATKNVSNNMEIYPRYKKEVNAFLMYVRYKNRNNEYFKEISASNLSDVKNVKYHFTKDVIIKRLSDFFHIKELDLISDSRKKNLVKIRYIGIWYLINNTDLSTEQIGNLFNRASSTVINVINQMEIYPKYKTEIDSFVNYFDNEEIKNINFQSTI